MTEGDRGSKGRRPAAGGLKGSAGGRFVDVDIRDFGPVSSASIRLCPPTVLSGPNGSGKSYVVLLLHSIIAAQASLPSLSGRASAAPPRREVVRRAYDAGAKRALLSGADSEAFVGALLGSAFRTGLRHRFCLILETSPFS